MGVVFRPPWTARRIFFTHGSPLGSRRRRANVSEVQFQAALRDADATGNWSEVITLYIEAAQGEAEAFYLTHAYIHALEAKDPRAPDLKQRLVALGSDVDDTA